ncbi:MAG: ADOP family duplicated permease [Gemmatimonadaceae bacterium]
MFSDLRYRLKALFNRSALERELDDELRFHLECEADKYVREGATRADAERMARVALGGVARTKEDTREARGLVLIQTLTQDLRYAIRGIRNRSGFTAAIVLTLGLGIGTNAAMFGIIDRLMFRPPAYLSEPSLVHRVYGRYLVDGQESTDNGFSFTKFTDLVRSTTSFSQLAAVAYRKLAVGERDEVAEVNVAIVSAALFTMFDAPPVQGRYFTTEEDLPPLGAPVAVLGHAFWQLHYGDANVIGKSLRIGDGVFTIIGVAPEGFAATSEEGPPAVFIPLSTFAGLRQGTRYIQNYGWTWMDVIVQRRKGVSITAANADLSLAYSRSWDAQRAGDVAQAAGTGGRFPTATEARVRAEAGPLLFARGPQADQSAHVATWVMGVAVIVLLIACANVTNLLLAHAVRRRREIALRLALGVTRRRLLQHLLTESLLLALLGGAFGMLVAQIGGRVMRGMFLHAEDSVVATTDGRMILFVVVVTAGVALLTGLAPALYAIRGNVADALKAGSREGHYRKSAIRTGLLIFQGAFSVVLLVGAGLFVRSFSHVRAQRLGYDVAPVAYAEMSRRGTKLTRDESNVLSERLREVASTVPGVLSASLTISVPFWSYEGRGAPYVPGVDSVRTLGQFAIQAGSSSYFSTVGTRIIRGRGFTEEDRENSLPIVVVSESMAKALWPGKDAIGRTMRVGADTNPFMTVVGVAEDMKAQEIVGTAEFWYYLPIDQFKVRFGGANPSLFIRVAGRSEDYTEVLRRRLQEVMPGEAFMKVVPLASLIAPRQRSWEFGAKMFVGFGVLALMLAAIGLYSVIAYMVAQRSHELAIRVALGASFNGVIRMIVMQGVSFAAIGIVIGGIIAFGAGRWIEPLLFAQKANDPVVYGIVASVLLVVALLASMRPALRAARVDPMTSLRSD